MPNNKLITYIEKIIKARDPNSIKAYVLKDIKIEKNTIEYSDIVRHWKEENDDDITKEYDIIKNHELPNIIGLFTMFYLKGKKNFLTVGKYNNDLFHLDIKCQEYSNILNMSMDSDNSVFILSYWIL
jgi:hypothetical protein